MCKKKKIDTCKGNSEIKEDMRNLKCDKNKKWFFILVNKNKLVDSKTKFVFVGE